MWDHEWVYSPTPALQLITVTHDFSVAVMCEYVYSIPEPLVC